MAANPLFPQGFRVLCDAADLDRKEAGCPIELLDLPIEFRKR